MEGLLGNLVGDEFDSQEAQLALNLAREDQLLLVRLIECRKRAGLTQQDVAEALGLSQASVSAFERLGNDPHLSTVRRYARAVGAMVIHHVSGDRGAGCASSEEIVHMRSDGIDTASTAAAIQRGLAPADWPELGARVGRGVLVR